MRFLMRFLINGEMNQKDDSLHAIGIKHKEQSNMSRLLCWFVGSYQLTLFFLYIHL